MKRIAIYSRKSKFTGKGNSIENQIEMCKEYISRDYGNDVEFFIYEDEGFSGATTNRPKFKQLMKDVESNKLDILLCYKLDRISRTVSEFSSTLEVLEAHNVSFVSITERFDTSSPMGRAMVYISSVFAQLERETIAERIKDNMLELAKAGKWTGGRIPLGFKSEKAMYLDHEGRERQLTSLQINEDEMKTVKLIYDKYLELGSLHKLEVYVTQNQIKSKNGIVFEKSALKLILQNPVYVKANEEVVNYLENNNWEVYGQANGRTALLTYNKTEQILLKGKRTKRNKDVSERFAAVSSIPGFIDSVTWLDVQKQFDTNRSTMPNLGKTHNALLTGKLICAKCNKYMLIQHGRLSKVTGEKLFYYVCSMKRRSKGCLCSNNNAHATDIEKLIINGLKELSYNKKSFLDAIEKRNTQLSKDMESINLKLSLEKTLSEKKFQMDNLIDKLSKNEDLEDMLLSKIRILKNECSKIQEELDSLEDNEKLAMVEKINIENIRTILNSCSKIDTLPKDAQKEIINEIIDEIYWDGTGKKGGNIKIKFIGYDDADTENSMLQFSSDSMCKVNKTTVYKEVFTKLELDTYNTLKGLPENTIGQKIYKLRLINRLSRREFAKKCNIGYSSLCKYETDMGIPNAANIKKMNEAFELDGGYLMVKN